ncbi:hypothetical protein FDI40_gp120 [Agrobacterium phage Atu_ph07]|uniref:Uncharacterized protein n=1 Tax=Agrobacterium phage Atu_ph07 TaxID=2024264 RepID=A0A2L0UZF3_9CAUD|nr:hypothetical protein FDI40_gp120 [Agrobacterium phage Atu_ph07]AUZ94917.1 hypothetical protein [Agrobacterium phage Atu_ph07]
METIPRKGEVIEVTNTNTSMVESYTVDKISYSLVNTENTYKQTCVNIWVSPFVEKGA